MATEAAILRTAMRRFSALRRLVPLGTLHNAREYDRARRLLDLLIDEIGEDEKHPSADLAEALGIFIERYEARHVRMPASRPRDLLRFLMQQHGLVQGDLPEIGSQGVVSEVLRGKRRLNARQIGLLSRRFGIAADLLID